MWGDSNSIGGVAGCGFQLPCFPHLQHLPPRQFLLCFLEHSQNNGTSHTYNKQQETIKASTSVRNGDCTTCLILFLQLRQGGPPPHPPRKSHRFRDLSSPPSWYRSCLSQTADKRIVSSQFPGTTPPQWYCSCLSRAADKRVVCSQPLPARIAN